MGEGKQRVGLLSVTENQGECFQDIVTTAPEISQSHWMILYWIHLTIPMKIMFLTLTRILMTEVIAKCLPSAGHCGRR